jgi:hypothetical protein
MLRGRPSGTLVMRCAVRGGEFVESELFPILGVAFTMVWWPVYAWANVYHNNALFTTPCTNQAAPSPP